MRFVKAVTVFVFSLFLAVFSQVSEDSNLEQYLECIEHDVCGSCVSSSPNCRWCSDPFFSKTQPRCNTYERLIEAKCSQPLIQKPLPDVYEVAEDRPLQDYEMGNGESVVQIQPQRIHLSVKPRDSKKIQFQYRPAKNYPLDLYYLMDLTWSMKDDKETLVSLRDDLPEMLKNLTNNFRLGFGTFAEKPVMPFIHRDEKRLNNPCSGQEIEYCESTYDFQHRLTLTDEVSQFIDKVNRSTVTANLDDAEAHFDALVQVLVCGDRIGWNEQSRKLIILLTDGILHTAGDGILGGAVLRNDGECHLDDNGFYIEATKYDYPSVGQIYKLLEKYKVNVIFAVSKYSKVYYDNLQKVLDQFTYISELESDSSNILKLVKKGYEEIVSVTQFKDDVDDDNIKLRYFSDCGVVNGTMKETKICKDVEFGMTLNFEVHISMDVCKSYDMEKRIINIMETQLGQDLLTVDLDLLCGCDCNNEAWQLTCPGNSHISCGICECDKGWSGPNCDCKEGDFEVSAALIDKCRDPKANSSMPCTGRGDCDCGNCVCDRGFEGKYCQCLECLMSRDNWLVCGGTDHGQCVCGECQCNPGWSGEACDCQESIDTCIAPGSSVPCFGKGNCVCGECECNEKASDGSPYYGRFCDKCQTCDNSICEFAEKVMFCHVDKNCTSDFVYVSHTNQTYQYSEDVSVFNGTRCIANRPSSSGSNCIYTFYYEESENDTVKVRFYSQDCSQNLAAYRYAGFGAYIIAAIVVTGLIGALMYKSYQIVQDRKAYAEFRREAEASMRNTTNESPLYISPIKEYKMPENYREVY